MLKVTPVDIFPTNAYLSTGLNVFHSHRSLYDNDSVNGAPCHQNLFLEVSFLVCNTDPFFMLFFVILLQMKYQEEFFHNQIENIHKATEDKEKMFERLLQEERSKARCFDVESGTTEDRMQRYKTNTSMWFDIILPLGQGMFPSLCESIMECFLGVGYALCDHIYSISKYCICFLL